MKVYLTTDKKPFEFSDYKVISPANGENPLVLDAYIDDGECQEIVVDKIISHVFPAGLENYVASLAKKLKRGGQLVINNIDAIEVTKAFYNNSLSLEQFNYYMFGPQDGAWGFYKNSATLTQIVEILKRCGLKIIHKRLPNLHFSVTAERPNQ